MLETVFEITEDEVDGGYSASALGYRIRTQASRWKRYVATSGNLLTATSTRP